MSGAQIESCASRIGSLSVRLEFKALMQRAAELHGEAWAVRREAWALYRQATGLPVQSKPRRHIYRVEP